MVGSAVMQLKPCRYEAGGTASMLCEDLTHLLENITPTSKVMIHGCRRTLLPEQLRLAAMQDAMVCLSGLSLIQERLLKSGAGHGPCSGCLLFN